MGFFVFRYTGRMRLDHLTPEQEARLPEIRQEWINHGQSCEPLDFDAAKDAVIRAYEVAGLKPPKLFLTANDPIECSLMAELLGKLVKEDRLNDFLEASARLDAGGPGRWMSGMPLPVQLHLKGRRWNVEEEIRVRAFANAHWTLPVRKHVARDTPINDVIVYRVEEETVNRLSKESNDSLQVQLSLTDRHPVNDGFLKSAAMWGVFVETSDDVSSKIVHTTSESPVNRSVGVQAVWDLMEVGPLQVSLKPVLDAVHEIRRKDGISATVPTNIEYLVWWVTTHDPLITPMTFAGDNPLPELTDPLQVNLAQVDLDPLRQTAENHIFRDTSTRVRLFTGRGLYGARADRGVRGVVADIASRELGDSSSSVQLPDLQVSIREMKGTIGFDLCELEGQVDPRLSLTTADLTDTDSHLEHFTMLTLPELYEPLGTLSVELVEERLDDHNVEVSSDVMDAVIGEDRGTLLYLHVSRELILRDPGLTSDTIERAVREQLKDNVLSTSPVVGSFPRAVGTTLDEPYYGGQVAVKTYQAMIPAIVALVALTFDLYVAMEGSTDDPTEESITYSLSPVIRDVDESPARVVDLEVMRETTPYVRGQIGVELQILGNVRNRTGIAAAKYVRETVQPVDLSLEIKLKPVTREVNDLPNRQADLKIFEKAHLGVLQTIIAVTVWQMTVDRTGDAVKDSAREYATEDKDPCDVDLNAENYLLHNLLSQIRYQTGYQPDYSRTQESLGDLKLDIPASDRTQLWKSVWSQVRGSHDSGWLAFYAAMKEFGVEAANKLTPMMDLAKSCGWWYPMEDVVILQQRHDSLKLDDQGRLHCEDGPAVTYPEREDGSRMEVYAINGVVVPKSVIDNSFTYQDIRDQQNDEVRRIMTERYGVGRYAEESGAVCLDQDWVPITKGSTQLMPRALFEFDDNSRWLYGTDGSTSRCYWMRVPGTVNTCRDAHRAICGLDESLCVAQS